MDMHNLNHLIFFLFFLSSPSANSNKLCPISYCPNNTLPIKYPFKLQNYNQTPNCSYTNLTCTSQGAVILTLPGFRDFYVRNIHYEYENPVIILSDPQNCLPKRFMASNSNNSSFTPTKAAAAYFLDYTFYSCPPNKVAWQKFPTIGCLSNSSSDVVAIRADLRKTRSDLSRYCNEMFISSMPVLRSCPPKFIRNDRVFYLEWDASRCESCPFNKRETVLDLFGYVFATALYVFLVATICRLLLKHCWHFCLMILLQKLHKVVWDYVSGTAYYMIFSVIIAGDCNQRRLLMSHGNVQQYDQGIQDEEVKGSYHHTSTLAIFMLVSRLFVEIYY